MLDGIETKARPTRGGSNRARRLRIEVLRALETGERSPRLRQFVRQHHGLGRILNAFEAHARAGKLAQAIYGHRELGQSPAYALRTSGAKASELDEARKLSKELGRQLGDFALEMPPETDWIADLRGRAEEMTVVLDQRAAEDMLLAALEAYRVPGRGQRFTEVYGICLGTMRAKDEETGGRGQWSRTWVNIIRCAPQIKAKATSSAVWPSDRSLEAQLEAARALFPQLEVVGDFHSHPYEHVRELYKTRGWEFSQEDEESNPHWVEKIRAFKHRPRVAFVVAIAGKERARTDGSSAKWGENTHQVTIGRHQCVIGAYRILDDGTYARPPISLHCTAMNVG